LNHYEELGLRQDASPDEIRAAYICLARLLHPDQQAGEELRQLAECQMKRLNFVYGVLSDPRRRKAYDASLRTLIPAAGRPHHHRRIWIREAGLVLAGLLLGLFSCWLDAPRNQPSASLPHRGVCPTEEPPAAGAAGERGDARHEEAELTILRRELKRLRDEREEVRGEIQKLRREAGHGTLPEPAQFGVPPEGATAAVSAAVGIPPFRTQPAETTTPAGLSGTWIYVPPRGATSDRPAYSAEFVEVVIVEESGLIKGRYRGRYRVPDRPISPEVEFRFEGEGGGTEASLNWAGAGGAKGEVALRLVTRDRLQVDWFTTTMGTQTHLTSGSAALTRRRGD